MAISTIQVRRGKREDFKPSEMLPGEWAVSIDNDTENQIVWMCFAPGVVKRMGTYEDFVAQVAEATADVRDEYKAEFDEIKKQIDATAETVQSNKDTVVTISNSIVNTYLPQIEAYVTRAETGATGAEKSATDADKWAKLSQSYARGDSGAREDEEKDNGLYYLERTRAAANSITGALKPKGNITFKKLTEILSPVMGDYYNVTDAFTSTADFTDGAGIEYPAGTDVYYTDENKWNAVQGAGVAGVKGEHESAYRKGLVNITKDNIGLGKVENSTPAEILGQMTKQQVTTALGYTPAGGENLVLDSAVEVSNSSYKFHVYKLSELISLNKTYTLTIWGEAGTECEFEAYLGGWTNKFGTASKIKEGIYRLEIFRDSWVNETEAKNAELWIYTIGNNSEAITNTIHKIKLEPGHVTDPIWTPSPQDALLKGEVDGRNLVLNSDINITSSEHRMVTLKLSQPLKPGETYTFSLFDSSLGDDRKSFAINGDIPGVGTIIFIEEKNGVFRGTVTLPDKQTANNAITIYQMEPTGTTESTVGKIKIERGVNPNPQYTPAPEDVVTRAELSDKYYFGNGEFITSEKGTARGFGLINIVISSSNFVTVYFGAQITTAGTVHDGSWGISTDAIKKLNNSVPDIVPIGGGTIIFVDEEGKIIRDLFGYGSTLSSYGRFWNPARKHTIKDDPNSIGGWYETNVTEGMCLFGVCFGRVSETATASADEAAEDMEIN